MRKTLRISLLLLCTLCILSGCNENEAAKPEPLRLKVVLAEVEETKVPVEASFNAVLSAKETVEVRAKISGYLKEKKFEEGSQVKAGAVIYKLDDRDLKASLATAHAQTVKAEAAWKNADTIKKRYIPLAASGAISVQDKDNAVARADENFAYYTAAKADEEKAAVNLSYATIIAPISGFINRSKVDVGGYVEAGSQLLTTIYNMNPIRAEFSVTDREYALMKTSIDEHGANPDAVVFSLYIGDDRILYKHPGSMEMADPVIDPKTNTIGIRVEFPNPDNELRPGLYANVTGRIASPDALTVPEEAVLDHDSGKAVLTVDDKHTVQAVPVELGPLVGERRVITKGMSKGQKVIVEGLVSAHPGMVVEVVEKNKTPEPPQKADGEKASSPSGAQ
ncbi:efflux RND transporter periplasmic adaptor subunit [Desulfovibrio sp. OttesenSCG-928-G15]|nr:efflux RND transporter periplasmic adaptor subunit [Desulfovibrio sp. OttesenSCG-928-G15]